MPTRRIMTDGFFLNAATARRIFERDIAPDIFRHARASGERLAILFGGQPGAGKTGLVDREAPGIDAVVIEGDQMHAYHPALDTIRERHGTDAALHTGPDAGRWTEMAIAHGIAQGYNLAIEGTMRSVEIVRTAAGQLRAAGYAVEAHVMAVPDLQSWQGVHMRYERQYEIDPRCAHFTPRAAHDAAYAGMLDTLAAIEAECLVDAVVIHTRTTAVIYDSAPGPDRDRADARGMTMMMRAAPFTPEQAILHDQDWAAIEAKQKVRGAPDAERDPIAERRRRDYLDMKGRDEASGDAFG